MSLAHTSSGGGFPVLKKVTRRRISFHPEGGVLISLFELHNVLDKLPVNPPSGHLGCLGAGLLYPSWLALSSIAGMDKDLYCGIKRGNKVLEGMIQKPNQKRQWSKPPEKQLYPTRCA